MPCNPLESSDCKILIVSFKIALIRFFCNFKFSWTGYSTPEFQPEELLNKHDYTGTCSNYSASGLKSLRFMGQIDTSTAFISLYNGTPGTDAFSGDEKIVTRASSDFSFTPTGVIISNAANWTGYENADFTGRAICFRSSTPGLTTFDLMTDSRVVKSVVKGCIS